MKTENHPPREPPGDIAQIGGFPAFCRLTGIFLAETGSMSTGSSTTQSCANRVFRDVSLDERLPTLFALILRPRPCRTVSGMHPLHFRSDRERRRSPK